MHTRLGDGGYVLSAGQEQLVAFARILVRDPHVVILDEATARLDPVTENRVREATERLLTDRIGIVIAHRLSSVRRCDEVVVMADGAVLEAGPLRESARFAELLATSHAGAYCRGGRAGAAAWSCSSAPALGRRARRAGRARDAAGRRAARRPATGAAARRPRGPCARSSGWASTTRGTACSRSPCSS